MLAAVACVGLMRLNPLTAFAPPSPPALKAPYFGARGSGALMKNSLNSIEQSVPGEEPHKPVGGGDATRRMLLTLPLLLYIVVNWAGSAEILQIAQKGYPYPLALTMVGACAPVSALPALLLLDACRGVGLRRSVREIYGGLRRVFRSSMVFAALHLGVEFMWIGSLAGTSVGTNTAIYNTYLAFVCMGSVALGLERLTRRKLCGVGLGLGGLALIWAGQGAAGSAVDTPAGVVMCLLSTLCFSAYQLAAELSGGEGVEKMQMDGPPIRKQLLWIFGLGLFSCLIVAASVAGTAAFGLPLPSLSMPSMKVTVCMAAVVFLQMTYQLGLFAAISATSALLVAGGSVTVIPTGYAFDYLLHGIVPSLSAMGACTLIIAGFVVLVRASMSEQAEAQRAKEAPRVAAAT